MGNWPLTKAQIRAHLKKRWQKKGNCTVCGSNEWVVTEDEYSLQNIEASKDYPVSLVYCDKCGATIFISSDIIRREIQS